MAGYVAVRLGDTRIPLLKEGIPEHLQWLAHHLRYLGNQEKQDNYVQSSHAYYKLSMMTGLTWRDHLLTPDWKTRMDELNDLSFANLVDVELFPDDIVKEAPHMSQRGALFLSPATILKMADCVRGTL